MNQRVYKANSTTPRTTQQTQRHYANQIYIERERERGREGGREGGGGGGGGGGGESPTPAASVVSAPTTATTVTSSHNPSRKASLILPTTSEGWEQVDYFFQTSLVPAALLASSPQEMNVKESIPTSPPHMAPRPLLGHGPRSDHSTTDL